MLYPLKFIPIYKQKVWGGDKIREIKSDNKIPKNCGESWEISAIEDDISVVSNGFLAGNSLQEIIEIYMGELVGDTIFDKFGYEFPLLIKLINSKENLSIQVHPDDNMASKLHNAWGKSEIWYVIDTDNDAKIASGFNTRTDENTFLNKINDNSIEDILNIVNIRNSQVFYIPAGRIHSLYKGATILEIQQTSDITYRIFDFGRADRDLHLDLATKVLDYNKTESIETKYDKQTDKANKIIQTEFFSLNFLCLANTIEKDYFNIDSFIIYYCTKGEVIIQYNDEQISITQGETILIPAELKTLKLVPQIYSEIVEVYIDLENE